MKYESFMLASGFSFGEGGGRYSILKPLGRGWEGEVYAIADTHIEEDTTIKAVKFTIVTRRDHSSAPSWDSSQIKLNRKNPFAGISDNDLRHWYQCLVDWFEWSEDQDRWKKKINDIKTQMNLLNSRTINQLSLIPRIEDYGVTAIPIKGNLQLCLYQILTFISGQTIPDFLGSQLKFDYETFAKDFLRQIISGVKEYLAAGFEILYDIHSENIIYDGKRFYLLDSPIKRRENNQDFDHFKDMVTSIVKLSLHILNWDHIGFSVSAHEQAEIWLEWLNEVPKLRNLPRTFDNSFMKNIEKIVTDFDQDAWPSDIWQ